jgi:TPR repeat protein
MNFICLKKGFEKNMKKSIELYEKAANLRNYDAMNELGKIYKDGVENVIEKDTEKAVLYFYKSFKEGKLNYALDNLQKTLELNVTWKREFHIYWPSSPLLFSQVFVLIILSKFRSFSLFPFVSQFFVKGVTMKIIQFLCHFQQNKK